MTEKRILFDVFEFPVEKGLEYLINENIPETDFLLINELHDAFSIIFDKDLPIFIVPQDTDRDYCLFEMKRQDRKIKFYCPEKLKNLDSVVWYFYLEMLDGQGGKHVLPGQVRVMVDVPCIMRTKHMPKFIEVLERVKLSETVIA